MNATELLKNPLLVSFEKRVEEENTLIRIGDMECLPELDVDLLRSTIEWAKKTHEVPEDFALVHNQKTWLASDTIGDGDLGEVFMAGQPTKERFTPENFCGTTACIAGSVALQFGEPLWKVDIKGEDEDGVAEWHYTADDVLVDGLVEDVGTFAARKLGLSRVEQQFMFYAGSSLETIEYIAERACERRGLRW